MIRIDLTQSQAEQLGIVFCKCGHRPNNHFKFAKNDRPCSQCDCKHYEQVIRLPESQL